MTTAVHAGDLTTTHLGSLVRLGDRHGGKVEGRLVEIQHSRVGELNSNDATIITLKVLHARIEHRLTPTSSVTLVESSG